MRTILLFIASALFMSNSLFAQTETANKKVVRDSVKKESVEKKDTVKKDSAVQEIIINDSWSRTSKTPVSKKRVKRANRHETNIGIGTKSVRIKEKSDTTIISFGNNELIISENGDNSRVYLKNKIRDLRERNFVGHWAGFEIGMASFKENLDGNGDGFMELSYPKSSAVNLNLIQGNFKLIGSKFGLVSGLGFSWYNFRFKDDITLIDTKDEDGRNITTQANIKEVYPNENSSVKKSKLTTCYLTLPLLLELQGNKKDMYISAGLIAGLRLGTHTKVKFNNGDKEKDFGDFNTLPYKLDATVRMGFNALSIWASYSLTPLFEKDRLFNNVNNKFENKTPIALGLSFNVF